MDTGKQKLSRQTHLIHPLYRSNPSEARWEGGGTLQYKNNSLKYKGGKKGNIVLLSFSSCFCLVAGNGVLVIH